MRLGIETGQRGTMLQKDGVYFPTCLEGLPPVRRTDVQGP